MDELYLYFRTVAAADDDALTGDSCCFPLSSFAGIEPTSAVTNTVGNAVTIYFKSIINYDGVDTDNTALHSDQVIVVLDSTATVKGFMREFVEATNLAKAKPNKNFLVIADDSSSEYFSSLINNVNAIDIQAILA